MSTVITERTVKVTIEVTTEYTADYQIDEAEYLQWLGAAEDCDDKMCEFLCSARDTFEIVAGVCDTATKEGTTEVTFSEIAGVVGAQATEEN